VHSPVKRRSLRNFDVATGTFIKGYEQQSCRLIGQEERIKLTNQAQCTASLMHPN